jgi:ATP-dependent exoDNAse (exonuclease V) alpha subunit
MAIDAVSSSGQAYRLDLAVGDEIRFLVRNDRLSVINGTTAIVTALREEAGGDVRIAARIGSRDLSFTSSDLADDAGKARLAHAYASTIYGAQGLTADQAFVLLDPACDRHDAYVGLSRARGRTEIFADRKLIDAGIRAEQPLSQRVGMAEPDTAERLAWLAGRLSRAGIKGTTLDLLLPQPDESRQPLAHHQRQKDHSYEFEST